MYSPASLWSLSQKTVDLGTETWRVSQVQHNQKDEFQISLQKILETKHEVGEVGNIWI